SAVKLNDSKVTVSKNREAMNKSMSGPLSTFVGHRVIGRPDRAEHADRHPGIGQVRIQEVFVFIQRAQDLIAQGLQVVRAVPMNGRSLVAYPLEDQHLNLGQQERGP